MPLLRSLRIFVFANCQGTGISLFLKPVLSHFFAVEILHIENFEEERRVTLTDAEQDFIRSADLCIYQPVHSFDNVAGLFRPLHDLLRPDVQRITFPYLYTNALWPLYEEAGKVKTSDFLVELIREGVTADALLALYSRGRLDFGYAERYERSSAILRAKEAGCDVKVQDFIDANLRDQRLFLTQNHPTSSVFIECVLQICEVLAGRLGIDGLRGLTPAIFGEVPFNAAGLPNYWPIDASALRHFGFRYVGGPDAEADRFYRLMIRKLVAGTAA